MADIPSTPADGNVKVAWVPAIADPTAPTVAELTGVGVVDLSCYLTADGWVPGLDEATITDDRLCSTQTYEQPGRATRSLTVRYVINPGDATNNAAEDTLVPGTDGYFVTRAGESYDTAFGAGDVVWVWPATAGKRQPLPPEANSVLKQEQRMFIRGEVQENVTLAA